MKVRALLRAVAVGALLAGSLVPSPPAAAATAAQALLVCNGSTYACPAGTGFSTIQAAVNAARPGDWVLVWPGVYHEAGSPRAGVEITTPGIHLRGLDRNLVIVDGTLPGAPRPCSSDPAYQRVTPGGLNGIEVYKANGVYVDNLTVCNYLSSPTGAMGNEVWWNGGDGSGVMGMTTWWGNYLSATSTYWGGPNTPMAMYGLFVSNAHGPGSLFDSYASNMADSALYIGACANCQAVVSRSHLENSALGYSGTNAGGHLVLENSEWDLNRTGIVPNSLNNDDAPPPQSGLCPGSTTRSCTIIRGNYVHDNNNPNVPTAGIAGSTPIGTGIEISGGSFDTVAGNRVEHNGSWGILIHDYPDTETPPPTSSCQGGTQLPGVCFFNAHGNLVHDNRLAHNGFFGNPGNADLGNEASGNPGNCFYENRDTAGPLTSDPPAIQSPAVDGPPCNRPLPGDASLAGQIVCASGLVGQCPTPVTNYPQSTGVVMLPMPRQAPMPNPCAGAPSNPWCPYSGPRS